MYIIPHFFSFKIGTDEPRVFFTGLVGPHQHTHLSCPHPCGFWVWPGLRWAGGSGRRLPWSSSPGGCYLWLAACLRAPEFLFCREKTSNALQSHRQTRGEPEERVLHKLCTSFFFLQTRKDRTSIYDTILIIKYQLYIIKHIKKALYLTVINHVWSSSPPTGHYIIM